MLTVGRRIREMRVFDMTQEEFAERIGISQNYLSTMERGKVEIGAEILLRIGREFGKSVEWLLTGKSSVSDLVTVIPSLPSTTVRLRARATAPPSCET
jgi:transcriptional regulator with XRE-family HTH domain